ncbi:molybdate ABC transporter substrate-binding protein [Arthrobacter sp. I2-34]|uniref:Molybdate ABC transporter substrate-binding protein n=1 Tax=Arthrobacter hankyongi TaxID=2904801 RepID=A0ABS9L284_9MICC|nr:molybdate ABC transporter substrate-binding protein [Arthrobacter hankyongi]MCG2620754.1 molybdate ABC transporter substrate-binding protein [Arthrobacter hankyongi]
MKLFRPVGSLLLGGTLAASLAACGSGTQNAAPASSASGAEDGTLTVFAAASLKQTFTELAKTFEQQHPGTKVALNFAGSSDLATQITEGAPADVFASADTKNMDKLAAASLVAGKPENFATNVLTIATPPDNPAGITSFADLAKPGVTVVVCAPQVPCGAAAQKVEAASGTTLKPASEESAVTDVLGKVVSGEADAGLVYVTDAKGAAGKVKEVPFPEAKDAVNTYPIAAVGTSAQKELGAEFIDLVTGEEGRKVLGAAGFGRP